MMSLGSLGRHVLVEMYDCNPSILDNRQLIESVMVDAALAAGAEVREVAFHKFSPQGVSGVVVISESHLTIHTWPELGYAAVDVFTCGERVDPVDAVEYIKVALECTEIELIKLTRGSISCLKERP